MTEWENERLTDNLIEMVNNHAAERQKILNRLSHSKTPALSGVKQEIIRLEFSVPDRFVIKNSHGNVVGTFNVGKQIKSKVILSGKRPVFVLYNKNNLCMHRDIMTGNMRSEKIDKETNQAVLKELELNASMIDYTKHIYTLIDNKDYDAINSYINNCMEQLIMANKVETSPRNIMDVYIRAQVLMRNIHNTQTKINQYMESGQDVSKYISELDLLYRQICEIFINVGFYEIPELDNTKITKC